MARADYQLGISDTEEPFGVRADRPHIARMLRGGKTGLRAELAHRYFNDNDVAASQQALADACMVLEGYAAQEPTTRVHLRVARHKGVVYVDMGDSEGRVIKMHNRGWNITSTDVPVLFRRTKLTGAYDEPQPGGDLTELRQFVPINDECWPLLLAWLIAALITPDVAHTILALIAEHGSAKSTITRCLVDLIDPSPVPLRQAPRDQQSWTTAASASWLVALDNLSGELPNWLSDCLCRAATGDGDVRRQLYTDNDVAVLAFRRAVIFNGVDLQVTQGDLADRLLRIDLKRIDKRLTDEELTSKWSQARPVILGGLLDLAAKVHARLDSTVVQNPPRMADFARVLAAVDQVLNTNGLAYYRQQRRRLAADTLDNPFTATLIQKQLMVADKTSADVLAALMPADAENAPKDWPKNSRAVTAQLTRDAPALREQGWRIDNDGGRNKECVVKWTITPPKET
ncbi:ATP-binding protein [Mycolicibacterium elephantis]